MVFDFELTNQIDNGAALTSSAVSQRVFSAETENLIHGLTALGVGGVIAVPTDTLYGASLAHSLSSVIVLLHFDTAEQHLLSLHWEDEGLA